MSGPGGQLAAKAGGASRMGGPVNDDQAVACHVLWRSGHFDTLHIAQLLDLSEDQVCRTLHATRWIAGGRA